MRGGGFWRLTLAVVALLAVAAAPAEAAKKGKKPGKLKTVRASDVTNAVNGGARATANCPIDYFAVSGGFTTRLPLLAPGSARWVNIEGNVLGQVHAQEYFRIPGEPLTAYAYCSFFGAGKQKSVSQEVPLTTIPRGATVATATCPKGFRVLSGGWQLLQFPFPTFGNAGVVTRSMRTGPRDWTVEATRLSGGGAMVLLSSALCGRGKRAKSGERSTTVPVSGPVGASFTATSPSCPKRAPAKAGGFATPPMPTGLLNGALVYEHYRAGRSWITSAAPSNDATSASVTSIVYCRR